MNVAQFSLHYRDLLMLGDPRPVELLTGLASITWGLWFTIAPLEALAGISAVQALNVLGGGGLGMVFVAVGALRLFALGVGALPWRQRACMAGFVCWAFVGFLGTYANPGSANAALYLCIALANVWCFLRLSKVLVG